jgi:hypothetical protein
LTTHLRLLLAAFLLPATASVVHAEPPLEVMPGLGMGRVTGESSDEIDVGPGFLLSIGARLHPMVSLRGQLNVDRPTVDPDLPGVDGSLWVWRIQLIPALHLGNEKVDFGFGPTLGLFYMPTSAEADTPLGRLEMDGSARGYTLGVQAWLMAKVSPSLSLGPVFSYGRLWATKVCIEATDTPEECDDSPENDQDTGYWNLSIGALF